MTGREKIEAAFSKEGAREIPSVICYERIFMRDHWQQLFKYPWWYWYWPQAEQQMQWRREAVKKIGQDWVRLWPFYSKEQRQNLSIEVRPGGVFMVDKLNRTEERLYEPKIGGDAMLGKPKKVPESFKDIDELITVEAEFNAEKIRTEGRADLAAAMRAEYGGELFTICHVLSPLWSCIARFGFENAMVMIGTEPKLVKYACERALIPAEREAEESLQLGASGIWIEDCMTDMISPEAFCELNVPYARRLVERIRELGLKSIYYYSGDPAGKWEGLFSIGADAISLEESKKNFSIDIEDIAAKVKGRFAVLGNLDAVGILQDGTEEQLRAEISRQKRAGRKNKSRFIMSLGSPVTPGTSVERVRLYNDIVHECGKL